MPNPADFENVLRFYLDIRGQTELIGSTEEFEQAFEVALERLRVGLRQDHRLEELVRKPDTPLGPNAALAFEAFKEWYASRG